jgi:hypothetical protein
MTASLDTAPCSLMQMEQHFRGAYLKTVVTHENLAVISDFLKYDTVAVHLFQQHLLLVTFLTTILISH